MKIALMFLVVLVVAVAGTCQVPPGFGAGAFANLGIHARALGMGGAFVAVPGDGPIPFYNPAGLQSGKRLTAGGMYAEPFGQGLGISLQNVTVTGRLGADEEADIPGFGAGFSWLGIRIDEILLWDEDDPLDVQTVSAGSDLLLASASMALWDGWSVGVSGKLYRSRILEGRGTGLGLDIGLMGTLEVADAPVTLGINATDIGRTRIQWRHTEGNPVNYVPWVNRIGASTLLWDGLVLLSGELGWAVARPSREQTVHLGIEVWPVDQVAFRGGWTGNLEGGGVFTGGVGLRLGERFTIDYAYVVKEIGGTHFASIRFLL